jgi:high-affinity nickel permease
VDASLTAALGLGFVLGVRHALDADHVAAVSTFVSTDRSLLRSCLIGAFWGAGHTAALLAAGIVTMSLKLTIPPGLEKGFETLVAVVLVLLGAHVLLRSFSALTLHRHRHTHDGRFHSHAHVHAGGELAHAHPHLLHGARRPFLVGLVHGLAGSAALMLLVLSTISSPLGGLLYILVFGVGSTGGMLVLSGLIGIPVVIAAGRSAMAVVVIQALAGVASLGLGLMLAHNLGVL